MKPGIPLGKIDILGNKLVVPKTPYVSQNMLLYFLLGKGNYTDEEKYIIMINTFMGKVHDWFSGLTDDAEKIIKNDTLEGHRWQVLLSFYSFTIEYIKGNDNFLADFISRNVQYGQSDKNPT